MIKKIIMGLVILFFIIFIYNYNLKIWTLKNRESIINNTEFIPKLYLNFDSNNTIEAAVVSWSIIDENNMKSSAKSYSNIKELYGVAKSNCNYEVQNDEIVKYVDLNVDVNAEIINISKFNVGTDFEVKEEIDITNRIYINKDVKEYLYLIEIQYDFGKVEYSWIIYNK